VSNAANPLTNDPIALRAMLAEERAENERLRQIIKELQRHRFGRRAESLPIDQLVNGGRIPGHRGGVKAGQWRRGRTISQGPRSGPLAYRRVRF